MGAFSEEVILALPERFEPLRHVRSTLLLSSINAMCEAGYEKAYFAALPTHLHDAVRQAVAGVWIPIEVALPHYQACSSLGLSYDAMVRLGRGVGKRVEGTLLGTVVRMSKGIGVTPWTVLPQFQRFWNRAFDGGGMAVYKVGPKEARIEVFEATLVETAYFRAACAGLGAGVLELFCTRAYMHPLSGKHPAGSCVYRIQWV